MPIGCVPDLDSLRGPTLNVGGDGDGNGGGSACDGGSCVSAAGGGAGGSTGGGGHAGSGGRGGSGGGGSGAASSEPRQLRYDFEQDSLALQGWVAVNPQRPVGVQDRVERTAEAAHAGEHSVRMVFDGGYPDAGAAPTDPFWGIQRTGGPPPDAEVSFWMMSTAPGVSIEVFAQTGNTYTWNVLANLALVPDVWREFNVFIPPSSAGTLSNWGMKVYAPLNIEGYIYLDEVTW